MLTFSEDHEVDRALAAVLDEDGVRGEAVKFILGGLGVHLGILMHHCCGDHQVIS